VNLSLLLSAFLAAVSPAGTGAQVDVPFSVSFPDVSPIIGEGPARNWVDIWTSETYTDADVQMRLDASGVTSIARVTTDTEGCTSEANVITCRRKMDIFPGGVGVAFLHITGHGQAGTGQIQITASVNGVSADPISSKVTVKYPPKVILLGANVKAPGKTKVEVTVGLKNIGKGPAEFAPIGPNENAVTHYIEFTGTFAQPIAGHCFPWGPYPGGWGWQHPNEPSYRFACASGPMQPGATSLYKFVVTIDPKHPLVTGYIAINHGSDTEPIVIDTRQETLPVTGLRVRDAGIVAFTLIVPGVVLLVFTRRTRRSRRTD
jgi:hypothetical protein